MTHIYKIANGSLTTAIGDTRLFYTGNYSVRAKAINGIFLDNPPVLSADYATLVWRYYTDTDRFMLIHVQGSQVVDASQGRNYPYRAAYEVTRDELNALKVNDHLPLTSLFSHMPRIQSFSSTERVSDEHNVAKKLSPITPEAKNLADRIIRAFTNIQPLYITINTEGRRMHENGVFNAPELQTLLTAIEMMPASLARYATFAFCADEHTAGVMDNIIVNVVVEGAKIQIPQGCQMLSWAEAIQPIDINEKTLDTVYTVASKLPGENEAMTPVNEASARFNKSVKQFMVITVKKPTDVAMDEWDTWFIRHDINEINISSWDEFIAMSKHMPEKYVLQLANIHHDDAIRWPNDYRMYSYAKTFNFSDAELASKLSIDLLIKINSKIIAQEGKPTDQENILALYKPQNIADGIANYQNIAKTSLDATERLLKQCIEIKKLRNRKQYAFNVLYTGIVNYLCQKYSNIDNTDYWKIIINEFWKMKLQSEGNKKKVLVYPLVFETLKVVFQSRINAMSDQQLSRFTSEVINQYSSTTSKPILRLVNLFYNSLG